MRVLCAADIHIGRTSTKLPAGSNLSVYTCSSAWNRIVECALSQNIDCIALAGDIVDRGNSRFEAIGSLEKGLLALSDTGIQVYAVSGNHDSRILPHIASSLNMPGFRLLGQDGNWECVEDPSGLITLGKSYVGGKVDVNPLNGFPELTRDHRPVLALLHSSLSSNTDAYAPVSADELKSHTGVIWVVGHVHQTPIIDNQPSFKIIIPGSPQALSPKETGMHGVYIAELDSDGISTLEQAPISSIRYENVNVSLDGVENELEIPKRVRDSVASFRTAAFSDDRHLSMLSLRVTFTGRTRLHGSIRAISKDLARDDSIDLGDEVRIEKLRIETGPLMDIESLAKADDVPGRLASIILAIDSGTLNDEYTDLFQKCFDCTDKTFAGTIYSLIAFQKTQEQEDQDLNAEQVGAIVRTQAFSLLSELISQRECG